MLEGVGISWPGGSPESTGLIVAVIVAAYGAVLWLSAVAWVARDIHRRATDPLAQLVCVLIVAIFSFAGLLIYLVLRPTRTLQEAEEHRLESSALMRELEQSSPCPRCGCEIGADYLVCPRCALALRLSCQSCERVLEPGWQICPWCTTVIEASGGDEPPSPNGTPAVSQPQHSVPEARSQHIQPISVRPAYERTARIPTLD